MSPLELLPSLNDYRSQFFYAHFSVVPDPIRTELVTGSHIESSSPYLSLRSQTVASSDAVNNVSTRSDQLATRL